MHLGWIKTVSWFLGLLTLLSACQPGPSSRSYARTTAFASDYRGGCGYNPCGGSGYVRPSCPPGYVVGRIPYSYGGAGRYCMPHRGRLSYGGGCGYNPCGGYGGYRTRYY